MNKIITSEETDIEFDPESMTDQTDSIASLEFVKNKRLEAIKDIEAMLSDTTSLIPSGIDIPTSSKQKDDDHVNCFMRVQTKHTNQTFNIRFRLVALSQNVIERTSTEIEFEASQKKLIALFTFYQQNILKQKRNKLKSNNVFKVFLKKTGPSRKRRKIISKNDIYVTKIYATINGQKINLIDCETNAWRINEMKYAFENNKPRVKVLLLRNK